MEIVGAKSRVTLGTFALPRLVSRLEAVVTEDVEAFGQHGVLSLHLTRRTGQFRFVFAYFFLQHLVGGRGQLELSSSFIFALE